MYAHIKPHPINKFLEANKIGIELICFPSHTQTQTIRNTNGNGNAIATIPTDKQYCNEKHLVRILEQVVQSNRNSANKVNIQRLGYV